MTIANRQRLLYVATDLVTTALAWLLFNVIRYNYNILLYTGDLKSSLGDFLTYNVVIIGQIILPLLMVGIFFLGGFYNEPLYKSRLEALLNTLGTTLIGTIVVFFLVIVNDPIPDRATNYELLFSLWLLMFGLVFAGRLIIITISRRQIRSGAWPVRTLVVGASEAAQQLCERLAQGSVPYSYQIQGMVAIPGEEATRLLHPYPIYPLSQLAELCHKLDTQRLIVATSAGAAELTFPLISQLFPLELPILVAPSRLSLIAAKQRIRDVAGEPLVDISHPSMAESTANLKRAGDIVVSAVALTLLLPVFAAIAFAIRRDSAGPVFYRQRRIGYHKRPFDIIKFRTMRVDAEASGPQLSSQTDERITRIGRFLRKYRLDELPQFWNVLRGEMSLVGPRPEREYYIRQIVARVPYYTLVHQVRPGITSWGMVKHGYASSVEQMIERFHFDLLYLENVSFLVDLKILIHTVRTVVSGQGV